jgi:DNA-binding PucR family transcriptional regulator
MSALHPDLEILQRDGGSRARRSGGLGAWQGGSAPVNWNVHEAVVAASRSLPPVEPLTERIRCRLLESWPAFGETPERGTEFVRAIDANLRHVFERVMPSASGDVLNAPADALSFAVSVLHDGLDTSDLLQAYRVGQNIAWSWWMEHLASSAKHQRLLLEAIELSSARMFAYVDAVVDEQVRLWEDERERWAGRLAVRRAEAVRRMLEGDASDSAEAAGSIGYSLERDLVAGILWEPHPPVAGTAPAESMERLELTAEAIARAVGVERTLIVPAPAGGLWLWFAIDPPLGMDTLAETAGSHLQEGQSLSLGLPGAGLEGFRAGHRQALRAVRLAELSHADESVIRFDEVEILCVMSEDPEALGEFVEHKLGALAAADENAALLRETVLIWLREDRSARRAADRLSTHRNTVLNRVQRAEELVGRSLCEDRLGLELALVMVERIDPPRAAG